LLDVYRNQRGSLLYSAAAAGETVAPVIHSTRLTKPEQVGVRVDHLIAAAGSGGANAAVGALAWQMVVASLTSLAFEISDEVKSVSAPVLPLYACELPERNWLVLYQIPVAKKHQSKLPQLMARIREDQALRAKLAFRLLTRECGALCVTFS